MSRKTILPDEYQAIGAKHITGQDLGQISNHDTIALAAGTSEMRSKGNETLRFHVVAPVSLRSSHDRNTAVFRSTTVFQWHNPIEADEIWCLGARLENFSLIPATRTNAELRFESDNFQTKEDVVEYMMKFESSLSAYYGKDHKNGYYGTPFVQIDYYALNITSTGNEKIAIAEKFSMTAETPLSVNTDILKDLFHNPIVSLYNDGLRAQDSKSKFLSWFTIIEEFVEKDKNFASKFEPLFSDSEKLKIHEFSKQFGDKGSALAVVIGRTKSSRHEKLAIMFAEVGITTIGAGNQEMNITPEICRALISDRNRLFHRGSAVNESRLYSCLYPLVSSIVELSASLTGKEH